MVNNIYHRLSNIPSKLKFEPLILHPLMKINTQNIEVALKSIRGQVLRTILTVMIIALGITALVGILTSIDALKSAINDQFTSMGANSFSIRNRTDFNVNRDGKRQKRKPVIQYQEALEFIENYSYPADLSVSTQVQFSAKLKYKNQETNPNIPIFASDELYMATSGFSLKSGRNFNENEIIGSSKVALIGYEIAQDLFKNVDPIGKTVRISNIGYEVIGVLDKKGSSFGFGGDKNVVIPISTGRQYYSRPNMNFTITILTNGPQHLEPAINEATGLFRAIRGDQLIEENSFSVNRSDNLASVLIDNISVVTIVATLIALITLLGAAIGLMNIMLVSVTERTKEIGTRMAIGAKTSAIRGQFLMEAIVICQIGGLVGIFLGITIGNVVSFIIGSTFIIPWAWILLGVVICLVTGVVAGFYPAQKASRLDPIEALRHE